MGYVITHRCPKCNREQGSFYSKAAFRIRKGLEEVMKEMGYGWEEARIHLDEVQEQVNEKLNTYRTRITIVNKIIRGMIDEAFEICRRCEDAQDPNIHPFALYLMKLEDEVNSEYKELLEKSNLG